MNKKILVILLSIVSVCCYSETRLQDVNYKYIQNTSFPIVGYRTTYKEFTQIDTVTLFEKNNFYIDNATCQYQPLSNGLYRRQLTWCESEQSYGTLFNNPIELGLYNRDKAKTSYWTGFAFFVTGAIMNIVGATAHIDYHEKAVVQWCSLIPYSAAAGSFIAGWVFSVRANRCFLVGSTNYEISASYKF